jgi:hypothetical protein
MRLLNEEFQGWSNRETWAVALYLDNDQGFYDDVQGLTREAIDNNPLNEASYRLADSLEDLVNELFEFDNVSTNKELFIMMADIGSLYRVDWREIAQGYITLMTIDKVNSIIGLQGVAL